MELLMICRSKHVDVCDFAGLIPWHFRDTLGAVDIVFYSLER